MSFKEKLKLWFLKQDPSLPPMEPAVKRKRDEPAPGTKELTALGYRVPLIDTIRGVLLMAALLYEIIYAVASYGMFAGSWFNTFCQNFMNGETLKYWRLGFEFAFILISGISVNYSKNKWKHIAKLLICSVIVFGATSLFFGVENSTWFGMIQFLTVAWAIYTLIASKWEKQFDKITLTAWIVLFLLSYIAVHYYSTGRWMIGNFEVPYYFIGFSPADFAPREFFGILPWIFVFFTGVCMGKYMRDGLVAETNYKFGVPGIDIIGRNGMLIYLCHIPVYALMLLIDKFV